ncbi:MAG: type II toxin-antitoxin system HicA family toxin [Gammaproteobacteria bacterium]|nr:type II toxin-antitoxin system HicA family toxin [Gammaproteobacteria bacterium]
MREAGWQLHHARGSHHQFKHPDKPGKVTLPHPRKDLPTDVVRSIERQSGVKLRRED